MQDYTKENHRNWILWGSILAVLVIGVGIFFYYTFLRQSKSVVLEAVPTNAAFIFEINDNETFIRKSGNLIPYLNELFVMDALPAFETVYNNLPEDQYAITISGHNDNLGMFLLFNAGIDKHDFKKLLKSLSIDPENYTPFEEYKIYTFGTNFKSLKMVYYNHILSISENLDLLKKALIQHKHPKNLLSDKQFNQIYQIVEKNKKQNWLILQNKQYLAHIASYLDQPLQADLRFLNEKSAWCAFQIRFSGLDMFLSGYATTEAPEFQKFDNQAPQQTVPTAILPFGTDWYYKVDIPDRALLLSKINRQKEALQVNQQAIAQFDKIAPASACFFDLITDSLKHYHYLAVLPDTLHSQMTEVIGNTSQTNDLKSLYADGIYPVQAQGFNKLLSSLIKDDFLFYTENSGFYIFASSKEAVKYYQRSGSQSGSLADNRYYKLAKDNIAGKNLLEFTYYNDYNRKPLLSVMSAKGKTSHFAHDLMAFSISCNELIDDYAAVNLYFHFGTHEPPTTTPTEADTDSLVMRP